MNQAWAVARCSPILNAPITLDCYVNVFVDGDWITITGSLSIVKTSDTCWSNGSSSFERQSSWGSQYSRKRLAVPIHCFVASWINVANTSPYCFYPLPLPIFLAVRFWTTVDIHAFILARERIVPSKIVGPKERLKSEKIMYMVRGQTLRKKMTCSLERDLNFWCSVVFRDGYD